MGKVYYDLVTFYNNKKIMYLPLLISGPMGPEGQFLPGDIMPPSSSPDDLPLHSEENFLSNGPGRPNTMNGCFPPLAHLGHRPEMTSEVW